MTRAMRPKTEETTMTMILRAFSSILEVRNTMKQIMREPIQLRMYRFRRPRKATKYWQFRLPTHAFTNGQWWSKTYTQWLQSRQWLLLQGRQILQLVQNVDLMAGSLQRKGRAAANQISERLTMSQSILLGGMMPGSVSVVRSINSQVDRQSRVNTMGIAGLALSQRVLEQKMCRRTRGTSKEE